MKTWLGAFMVLSITAGSPAALAAPRHGPVIVITQRDLLQARTASVETHQRPSVLVITQKDLLQARTASVEAPQRPSVLVITQKDLALDEQAMNLHTLDTVVAQALPPLVTPPRTVSLKTSPISPAGLQPGPAAMRRSAVRRPALRRFLRRAIHPQATRSPKPRERSRWQRLGPFAVQ